MKCNFKKKFLFVKLGHIGDTLLLTPTLAAVRKAYPDARIDVLVRRSCEGILKGCQLIDHTYITAAPESNKRSRLQGFYQVKQIVTFRTVGYDYAFDFTGTDRSRLIVGLSGAKFRVSNTSQHKTPFYLRLLLKKSKQIDCNIHQVEIDFNLVSEVLNLPDRPGNLVFSRDCVDEVEGLAELKNYAVIHITSRWKRKEWPFDRWEKVVRFLLEHVDFLVVDVGTCPGEMSEGKQIAEKFGAKVICPEKAFTFAQLAGLLYDARLFVGLDSASMHLAAACQTPSVALFGPFSIINWAPWRLKRARVLSLQHDGKAIKVSEIDISKISTDKVISACKIILEQQF